MTKDGEVPQDWIRDYYNADLGSVPEPIEVALQEAPDALAGYMGMRAFVLPEDPGFDELPKEHVNLIFVVLDVASGNADGALNHARAALRAGLPWRSLMQALVQVWIVFGFASTWGTTGHSVVETLRQEGFHLPSDEPGD